MLALATMLFLNTQPSTPSIEHASEVETFTLQRWREFEERCAASTVRPRVLPRRYTNKLLTAPVARAAFPLIRSKKLTETYLEGSFDEVSYFSTNRYRNQSRHLVLYPSDRAAVVVSSKWSTVNYYHFVMDGLVPIGEWLSKEQNTGGDSHSKARYVVVALGYRGAFNNRKTIPQALDLVAVLSTDHQTSTTHVVTAFAKQSIFGKTRRRNECARHADDVHCTLHSSVLSDKVIFRQKDRVEAVPHHD